MSVTIINNPKNIDFAGNGLKYKVKGDSYVISESCKAKFGFRKAGTLAVDEIFYLPIPDNSSEGIQIIVGYTNTIANSVSVGATIEETATEMNAIVQVSKYYKVTVDADELVFEFKEEGGFDAAYCGFFGTSYQDIFDAPTLLYTSCLAKEVEQDYYIYAVAEFQGTQLTEVKGDVNADGQTEFDFGKFIPKKLFPLGTIASTYSINTTALEFTAKFSEHKNGEDWPFTSHSIAAVLPGKIDFNQYPDFSISAGFLTSQKRIDTHKEAFHKFAYLFQAGAPADLQVFAKSFYSDGTDEIVALYSDTFNNNQICFVYLLISELIEGKEDIYRIDIYTDNSSDSIKMYLSDKSYADKQFAFINSFGFWEVMNAVSLDVHEMKTDKLISKRYVPSDYDQKAGEYSSNVANSHIEVTCESGSKTDSEIEQVKEMLRSEYVYEIIGTQYRKIEILSDSVQVKDESTNLQNIQFSYMQSYDL